MVTSELRNCVVRWKASARGETLKLRRGPRKSLRSQMSPRPRELTNLLKALVGARGFEPPTPCAQGRCATRLRYAPTENDTDDFKLVSRIWFSSRVGFKVTAPLERV